MWLFFSFLSSKQMKKFSPCFIDPFSKTDTWKLSFHLSRNNLSEILRGKNGVGIEEKQYLWSKGKCKGGEGKEWCMGRRTLLSTESFALKRGCLVYWHRFIWVLVRRWQSKIDKYLFGVHILKNKSVLCNLQINLFH